MFLAKFGWTCPHQYVHPCSYRSLLTSGIPCKRSGNSAISASLGESADGIVDRGDWPAKLGEFANSRKTSYTWNVAHVINAADAASSLATQ